MTHRSPSAPPPSCGVLTMRAALLAMGAAALLAATGCVQRRLLIRSDPPGAVVYVDHQRVGTTPCAVNYVYYGSRKIRLIKDGFETLEIKQPVPAPWYEIPPLDFVSDVLVPYEIRDVRSVTYRLQPQLMVPREQLLARAEQLRQGTKSGTPLSPRGTLPAQPQPGMQTLPPSGQPIYFDEEFPTTGVGGGAAAPLPLRPGEGAQTLPPGGLEYAPPN